VRVEIGKYYRVNSDMFCFNLDEAMFPKTKEEFEDIEFLGFFQVVTTTSNILKMIKNFAYIGSLCFPQCLYRY
jgi:hypothetical protein